MQKQERFYYQSRVGTPTDTDAGYIAYIWYYRAEKFKKRESPGLIGHLLVKGWVLSSDWFSFPGLDSNIPGLAKGSDWFAGGGVRSGDFQRLFSRNLTKRSSFDSSLLLLPSLPASKSFPMSQLFA